MTGLIILTIVLYVIIVIVFIKIGKEMGLFSIPLFFMMAAGICFEDKSYTFGIILAVISLISLVTVLIINHNVKVKESDPNSVYIYKATFLKRGNKLIYKYKGRRNGLDGVIYQGIFDKLQFSNWSLIICLGFNSHTASASHLNLFKLRMITDKFYHKVVYDHEQHEVCNTIKGIYLTTNNAQHVIPLRIGESLVPDKVEVLFEDLTNRINRLLI